MFEGFINSVVTIVFNDGSSSSLVYLGEENDYFFFADMTTRALKDFREISAGVSSSASS